MAHAILTNNSLYGIVKNDVDLNELLPNQDIKNLYTIIDISDQDFTFLQDGIRDWNYNSQTNTLDLSDNAGDGIQKTLESLNNEKLALLERIENHLDSNDTSPNFSARLTTFKSWLENVDLNAQNIVFPHNKTLIQTLKDISGAPEIISELQII